jgi:hypothetical protein
MAKSSVYNLEPGFTGSAGAIPSGGASAPAQCAHPLAVDVSSRRPGTDFTKSRFGRKVYAQIYKFVSLNDSYFSPKITDKFYLIAIKTIRCLNGTKKQYIYL